MQSINHQRFYFLRRQSHAIGRMFAERFDQFF
jgi:hypothetical protein